MKPSNYPRILILNNACGPLTELAMYLKEAGAEVELLEGSKQQDLNLCIAQIEAFQPDLLLQQNMNLFCLSTQFGLDLMNWLSSKPYKQAFWFLNPLRSTNLLVFEVLKQQDNFKSFLFLCGSKAIMQEFQALGANTLYFPPCVSKPLKAVKSDTFKYQCICYSKSLIPINQLKENTAGAKQLLTEPRFQAKTLANKFFEVLRACVPDSEQQQQLLLLIEQFMLPALETLFANLDICPKVYGERRDHFYQEMARTLPTNLADLLLKIPASPDSIYTDAATYNIIQQLRDRFDLIAGCEHWHLLGFNDETVEVAPLSLFSQAKICVSNGLYLNLTGPDFTPLQAFAAGSLSLSEHKTEIYDLIPVNTGITYNSIRQLESLLETYAKDDARRQDTVEQAQNHIFKHHTFDSRVETLLTAINPVKKARRVISINTLDELGKAQG